MAQMAQGIVGGEMPWALILFGMALAVVLILLKSPSVMLVAVGMYLPPETPGAIFLGGCLKALVDWRAKRKSLSAAQTAQVEGTGTLVASGLIAGESLTGVLLAGLVLAFSNFSSIRGALGVPEMGWVESPLGAAASLVPLAVLVWLLVGVPIRNAIRRAG
jgi:uncharacterized oligopeptide transporter (OPT) family protein